MSFYTSLSGLKAAQTDLSAISNNIANVGSIGFKKSRTEFGDLVSASPLSAGDTVGGGTRLQALNQEFSQGGFELTDRSLDVAISGQGFLVTRSNLTGGQVAFTRNGSLTTDSNNYVTDASGAYVQVLPVDALGNVTATGLGAMQNLQIPPTTGQAKQTSAIDMTLTLPASADLPATRDAYTDSGYTFSRDDPDSYNQVSSSTVYDSTGKAIPATVYYVRTSGGSDGSPTSTWDAHIFVGDKEVPGPLQLSFGADGKLTAPLGDTLLTPVQPTGAAAPLALTLTVNAATKQNDGAFTVNKVTQNGSTTAKLSSVTVGTDGLVTAAYSDGTTRGLGKLAMANFANPEGLRQLGNSKWAVTGDSGDPLISAPGDDGLGVIQSGALEQANVDITDELVALIAAQRNFQANAKAIDTANQLTQTIVQLR